MDFLICQTLAPHFLKKWILATWAYSFFKVHLSGSPGPSKIVKCESPVIDVDMDQVEEIKVG